MASSVGRRRCTTPAHNGARKARTPHLDQPGPDMTTTLTLVIYMAILTWLTTLVASLIRVKGWTSPGTRLALGTRDNWPEATRFAGRAERTARNTFENFVLF